MKTDTFTYWPYGEESARTGTTATPFRYVGGKGYHGGNSRRTYVRARYLSNNSSRWLTADPAGIRQYGDQPYVYASSAPTVNSDPSGLVPKHCVIDPDCPAWVREMVGIWCHAFRRLSRYEDRINSCIRNTAGKFGKSCNPLTRNRRHCIYQFCGSHGQVKCQYAKEGDLDCKGSVGYAKGFKERVPPHSMDVPVPMTIIKLCITSLDGGYQGQTNLDLQAPGGSITFLHELAHACGIAHPGSSGERDRQCNMIWSCCFYDVIKREGTGKRCWEAAHHLRFHPP